MKKEPSREGLISGVDQPLLRQMEIVAEGYPEKAAELLGTYRLFNEEHHEDLIG